jgi:hypothetical protein
MVEAPKGKESKKFFFEKKNQKTFIRWVLRRTDRCANSDMDKSFLVLFFKKELLSCATLFL